jgi:hypothetical protein
MLVATRWLTGLDGAHAILDSQGSSWPRHRFLYGCLFSVRLDLLRSCGAFPDALKGWGYNDTLVAVRLEASGAFLLPVTSAWGHHIQHDIRHPAQWFQYSRNRLAYEFLLTQTITNLLWRDLYQLQPTNSFTSLIRFDGSVSQFQPQTIQHYPPSHLHDLAGGKIA